jgi:hypothetical protein
MKMGLIIESDFHKECGCGATFSRTYPPRVGNEYIFYDEYDQAGWVMCAECGQAACPEHKTTHGTNEFDGVVYDWLCNDCIKKEEENK